MTSKPYLSLFALPDDFDKLLATMRSREISVSIIIQNIAQLKYLYKDQHESIVGNCDSLLYLGGNETGSHDMISKALGKSSITITNHSQSKGKSGSYSSSDQIAGRELLLPDEVRMMDNSDCILLIRGEPPIMDKKYDLLRHPNIKRTPDGGGEAYRHGELTYIADDLHIDMAHIDDYEILTAEEFLGITDEQEEANAETEE